MNPQPAVSIVIGTRAQLIKMAPVMRELERRDIAYQLLFTGQHQTTMDRLLREFAIRTRPVRLYDGPEISGLGAMARWFPRMLLRLWKEGRAHFPGRDGTPHLVVVHGDTFSTLLGALAGRVRGARIAHVESGLRSFRLLHPFPEELTRLACFHLAHIAYCPGDWAMHNLRTHTRLERVNTVHNTLVDSLRLALAADAPPPDGLPKGACVASIHRFENLFRATRLEFIVERLVWTTRHLPVVFVMHPATRRQLERHGLIERLQRTPGMHLVPRMTYAPFVQLLRDATCVITDGGSNQEELAFLGIPTLLMRKATERLEGIGDNVVLCGYDAGRHERFVHDALKRRENTGPALFPAGRDSPSRRIVDHMASILPLPSTTS